ncbi:MAG: hypothetical protein RRB13_03130 [bacterium]|nr:hypothetical protein [bacterium]
MLLADITYPKDFLYRCLSSDYAPLAHWGALQLLRGEEREDCLEALLSSPLPLIQEAALVELAERAKEPTEVQQLVPLAVKLFREAEGQLKYQAAYCLSRFPGDFTENLLSRWAHQALVGGRATRLELEMALFSWLQVDPEAVDELLARLDDFVRDPVISVTLFCQLLPHCTNRRRFDVLMDYYFQLRDHHGDLEPLQLLRREVGSVELCRWVGDSLVRAFGPRAIYSQACGLLCRGPQASLEPFWNEVEAAGLSLDRIDAAPPQAPERMIKGLQGWLERLLDGMPEEHPDQKALWLVSAFERHLTHFQATTPRSLHLELELLLALPLSLQTERTLERWLENPENHLEEIAAYYHSALLTGKARQVLLQRFFPSPPDWDEEQLKIEHKTSPFGVTNRTSELLWSFFRGELLGYPVPYPSIFPNPVVDSALADGLIQLYLVNFEDFLARADRTSVDYALQLFQLRPTDQAKVLINRNFEVLHRYHADFLYRTLELMPDAALIPKLEAIYQPGEFDLARLLAFLCFAFEKPLMEAAQADLKRVMSAGQPGMKKPVRLFCHACGNSYQYFADVIYVDEGAIQTAGRLDDHSVWTPNPFRCKGCGAEVPFRLDEHQLEELTLQSKVDRLLRLNASQPGLGQRILLVDFPQYMGKSFDPAGFNQLVKEMEANQATDPAELRLLWLKLARLDKSLSRHHEGLRVLSKLDPPLPKEEAEWNFLSGICHYRLGDYAKARPHFDWVVHFYGDSQANQPFQEEAKSFLKSMSEDRRRFLVIEGRK